MRYLTSESCDCVLKRPTKIELIHWSQWVGFWTTLEEGIFPGMKWVRIFTAILSQTSTKSSSEFSFFFIDYFFLFIFLNCDIFVPMLITFFISNITNICLLRLKILYILNTERYEYFQLKIVCLEGKGYAALYICQSLSEIDKCQQSLWHRVQLGPGFKRIHIWELPNTGQCLYLFFIEYYPKINLSFHRSASLYQYMCFDLFKTIT